MRGKFEIYKTAKGKRYIMVHGRRMYIKNLSHKDAHQIWKSLRKHIKPTVPKRRKNLRRRRENKAVAIIKQVIGDKGAHVNQHLLEQQEHELKGLREMFNLHQKNVSDRLNFGNWGQMGPKPRPPGDRTDPIPEDIQEIDRKKAEEFDAYYNSLPATHTLRKEDDDEIDDDIDQLLTHVTVRPTIAAPPTAVELERIHGTPKFTVSTLSSERQPATSTSTSTSSSSGTNRFSPEQLNQLFDDPRSRDYVAAMFGVISDEEYRSMEEIAKQQYDNEFEERAMKAELDANRKLQNLTTKKHMTDLFASEGIVEPVRTGHNLTHLKNIYRKAKVRQATKDIESIATRTAKMARQKLGSGDKSMGLWTTDIEKVMQAYPEFKGVIARDEINTLLPKVEHNKPFAFIINLDPSSKPGSHWVAVYIDPIGSKSIEYFDSFGREIPNDVLKDIKLIIDIMKPTSILKVKSNHVIHQHSDTMNCGYFAMAFLIDRFRGKSFAEASGFENIMKFDRSKEGEEQIERLKKLRPFSYLSRNDDN